MGGGRVHISALSCPTIRFASHENKHGVAWTSFQSLSMGATPKAYETHRHLIQIFRAAAPQLSSLNNLYRKLSTTIQYELSIPAFLRLRL